MYGYILPYHFYKSIKTVLDSPLNLFIYISIAMGRKGKSCSCRIFHVRETVPQMGIKT